MNPKQAAFIAHGGYSRTIACGLLGMAFRAAPFLMCLFSFLGFAALYAYAQQPHEAARVYSSGIGLEVISGFVTAPSSTFTAWTMAAGNSLTVRNFDVSKRAYLLQAWAENQVAGTLRIRSAKMHDNSQGIRLNIATADTLPLLPIGHKQPLYPGDTLVAEQTGSAVGGQIESGSFLVFYEDLPGSQARLISYDDAQKRGVNLVTVEVTPNLGTTGGYSGEVAITASFDLLKAGVDYALLGYLSSVNCCTIRIRGTDTSNLGVGGPGGTTIRPETASWFSDLSRWNGLPLIPVFNMANKGGVLVDGIQSQTGTDSVMSFIFAELGK